MAAAVFRRREMFDGIAFEIGVGNVLCSS